MEHIRAFATERLWSRYHTPRSLVLAIMGELGELAEMFQWRGDEDGKGMEGWSQEILTTSVKSLPMCQSICYVWQMYVGLRILELWPSPK